LFFKLKGKKDWSFWKKQIKIFKISLGEPFWFETLNDVFPQVVSWLSYVEHFAFNFS
jgi:hypothetical protein